MECTLCRQIAWTYADYVEDQRPLGNGHQLPDEIKELQDSHPQCRICTVYMGPGHYEWWIKDVCDDCVKWAEVRRNHV